jgi:hypothetical protein
MSAAAYMIMLCMNEYDHIISCSKFKQSNSCAAKEKKERTFFFFGKKKKKKREEEENDGTMQDYFIGTFSNIIYR